MTDKRFKKKLQKIYKQGERYKKEKKLRDAYAKYYPDKKKKKVSNIMLAVSVCAVVWYVVADIMLQYYAGIEISPTITPFWFSFWGGEIFALMGIRVSKLKHNCNNESYSTGNSDNEACG